MDYILPSMREMSILGGAKPTLEQKLAIESGEKPLLFKNQILISPNQRLAWAALSDPVARHANIVGGTRSGKTFLIMRAIMARAIKAPETRHAVLRLHGNAARASVALDTLPNVMKVCFPGVRLEEKRQDGYFLVPNGSQIWIGGLDDKDRIEKILGTEFSTIFLNEASQIPYSSFLVAMTRLAQVHEKIQQRAYIDLNPVGKTHWTNKLFGLHIDPISNQPLRNPEAYARAFLNPVDNAHNLSKEFLDNLSFMPEKQRKRFFEGVYVDEVEGALWTYGGIDQHRCSIDDIPVAQRQRVVIAVDPSGAKSTDDEKADEIGIIAAAKGMDGKAYILEDGSLRASPREWAMKAIGLYHKYQADVMVAEGNFGGALVEATIKAVDQSVNVKMVTASRGKVVRAEPIAAHHDGGRIKYAGKFPKLEDQLCAFSSDGYKGADSPDHADACLIGNTLVATERGYLPIKQVVVGDRVLTREGYNRVTFSGMTQSSAPVFAVWTSNGCPIVGTKDHPIFVKGGGFTAISNLAIGQELLTEWEVCGNVWSKPRVIERIHEAGFAPVYNLHVEDCHEFIAEGVLVHNCVWAVTELLGTTDGGAIIEFYRQLAEEQEARKAGSSS